jgi:hypothetical protein
MWSAGRFALKPIDSTENPENKNELTIQLFWQPKYDYKQDDRIDLLKEPASSKGLKSNFLSYVRDGNANLIESGQLFKLTTTNPDTHPLPDREILHMQWVLQRLVSMSGAADWLKFGDRDNDSDGIPLNDTFWDTENLTKWVSRVEAEGLLASAHAGSIL